MDDTDSLKMLTSIQHEVVKSDVGEVADYIPELARVRPDHFGIHLTTNETVHGRAFASHDRRM